MKNKKQKIKNKKKTIEIFENIKLHSDFDYFYMKNPDYFLTFNDSLANKNQINNGIDIVETIIVLSQNYNNEDKFEKSLDFFKKENKIKENFHKYSSYNSYIAQEYPIKNISDKNDPINNKNENKELDHFIEKSENIAIINFMNRNLNLIKITDNLEVAKVKRGLGEIELDLNQIIYIDRNLKLKELIHLYKIGIETKIKYFEYLRLPEHIQDALNNNETITLACKSPVEFKKGKKQDLSEMIYSNNYEETIEDIEKELINCMIKSCNNFLENLNLSFGILDYIIAEGISIDSLVDAGMELCVGVEETPEKTKELKLRLKNQILKSLEDINVVALLMSAIRCEEDFQSNRIREVDFSDDPAYLYTDEVLGIVISNQIAGTKATFNFKRYDEAKPGIISKLGPMVDDIFAGLIAGCMSKIFEEDY
ncbi:hypothetical protein ALNOE001_20850 [Candidatus Methanobinarius endosymbioticus]|uniref:YutG/PgpA domain-containing protein n=1 Tax=Candidatus Methanobinarius endosymbioticus TaxID=2006182 RepID=A0A366MA15_9EURY|nr:hypothetical protein ALNOE001_20850 [Candidatus Methanobinarius endosymbioticus]